MEVNVQQLKHHARRRLGIPANRQINNHPDVQLLAQTTCFVAGLGYAQTGELTSRNRCFLIVLGYLHDELWPLTEYVPTRLKARSVFVGGGLFKNGSWRRWVGDIHGAILAQRFEEGAAPRRSQKHDQRAKTLRAAADKHLRNVIAEAAKLASQDQRNEPLLRALHQLHAEVI
ncbi:MAG: hypothetical protein H0W39_06490 [Sphingomonas sp.]|nr:hypothetical protein [Sphingomonas sp.]